jgi:hypothetical protein
MISENNSTLIQRCEGEPVLGVEHVVALRIYTHLVYDPISGQCSAANGAKREIHHCTPSWHNRYAAWGNNEEVAVAYQDLPFAPRTQSFR